MSEFDYKNYPSYCLLTKGNKIFTVIIDTRERIPLRFNDDVLTVRRKLPEGDYAIDGYEKTGIVFERKRIGELIACLVPRERKEKPGTNQNKEGRFYEEIERLIQHEKSYIVVEGDYWQLKKYCDDGNTLMSWPAVRGLEARLNDKIEIRYCSTPQLAAQFIFTKMRLWLKDKNIASAQL